MPRSAIDELPPEARFAVRGVAAGLSFDDVADVLRLDGAAARKHLRTAIREIGPHAPPPAAADDAALGAALAPALALAAPGPGRASGLRCPADDVSDALAGGALDGPLMLAQAEHAADCAACMARLVGARRGTRSTRSPPRAAAAAERGYFRPDAPLVLGVALGFVVVAAYLFLR